MKPRHHQIWDEALANPGVAVPIGDLVVCDGCDVDYSTSNEHGGFLMQSKAICPVCAPEWLKLLKECNEEHFIVAHCPAGQSFADWIRSLRPDDAAIKVTGIKR